MTLQGGQTSLLAQHVAEVPFVVGLARIYRGRDPVHDASSYQTARIVIEVLQGVWL